MYNSDVAEKLQLLYRLHQKPCWLASDPEPDESTTASSHASDDEVMEATEELLNEEDVQLRDRMRHLSFSCAPSSLASTSDSPIHPSAVPGASAHSGRFFGLAVLDTRSVAAMSQVRGHDGSWWLFLLMNYWCLSPMAVCNNCLEMVFVRRRTWFLYGRHSTFCLRVTRMNKACWPLLLKLEPYWLRSGKRVVTSVRSRFRPMPIARVTSLRNHQPQRSAHPLQLVHLLRKSKNRSGWSPLSNFWHLFWRNKVLWTILKPLWTWKLDFGSFVIGIYPNADARVRRRRNSAPSRRFDKQNTNCDMLFLGQVYCFLVFTGCLLDLSDDLCVCIVADVM